jgi:ABC-type Zn uptake system ZnuABC Zn-binding protein ZnuA
MKQTKSRKSFILLLTFIPLVLAACVTGASRQTDGKFQVLATTSIVGDVVAQVGGNHVQVTILLPLSTDPHTFEPRPQDAAALADAQLIFASGAGLEEFLQPLLESSGSTQKLVEVSAGIDLLPFVDTEHPDEADDGHQGGDPHTWMDPSNMLIWVDNIAAALAAADPENAADYQANAGTYRSELDALDGWIRSRVEAVPVGDRKLVSDHAVLGYFAHAYGFTVVGTVTGSFSTSAAPSARELAALEDNIRSLGVKAVFVGETANQVLARQVAVDTGIQVVTLYHASLTDASGPAASYLEFMRYNVNAIVEALK